MIDLFPAPYLAGLRASDTCGPWWYWWPIEWKPGESDVRYSLCTADKHYIPLVTWNRLPFPLKQCPECDTPPYRPYSLQQFAADVLAEDPDYPAWYEEQEAKRLAKQREEDANFAMRGTMQGLADFE